MEHGFGGKPGQAYCKAERACRHNEANTNVDLKAGVQIWMGWDPADAAGKGPGA